MSVKKISLCAAAAVAAVTLAACQSSASDSETKVDTATSAPASAAAKATTAEKSQELNTKVMFEDGYVKAKGSDNDMTAIFGTLHNHSDKALKLVSFSSDLNAPMNQIHEVVDGKMQEKAGGIEVPAHGSYELKPGGDHLMLMGVKQEIAAGDSVKATLKFDDGTELKDIELPVRAIGAGQENYGHDGSVQGDNGVTPVHNHG